jgi:hypothetical protein
MHIQKLKEILTREFDADSFLELSGQLTGDKLGGLVPEKITLPAHVVRSYKPEIYRGSARGTNSIGIYAIKLPESTLKNGFKIRRQLANSVINANDHNDAIVAFYADGYNQWRFGFIRGYKYDALESLREFQVGVGLTVRTASDQLSKVLLLPVSTEVSERPVELNKAFSVEAVSDTFYDKFRETHFDKMVSSIIEQGETEDKAEDLAVLFTIRIMFLGFVQRKGWLADDQDFLMTLHRRYLRGSQQGGFYDDWLKPLFFEALNGFGVHISSEILPEEIKEIYQMLPYLNGGLFHVHEVDKRNYHIDDAQIESFFTFLFSYNFTIEENTLQEQSLELNPELLGIIFERLVNKKNGAVYTPRTEVDFMCRISIVKWLQQNLEGEDRPDDRDLFELFFREKGGGKEFDDDQKTGSFSTNQKIVILEKLKSLAVCDPAVGSGAFPVGMMYVLNEVRECLGEDKSAQTRYERKKHIIGRNLYGVEVNEWAVWISQLRLWLSLFIDAPDVLRQSFEPILPSLDFKILQGDSLVQTIGNTLMPIEGHAAVDAALRRKVTELRKLKVDFYNNKLHSGVTLQTIHDVEVAVTRAMIMEQRDSKKRDLQVLLQTESITQQSLLGDEPEKVVQQTLGEAEERERLQEISKLDNMLSNLSKQPKTIWSISFAEVFADKGGFDIVIGNPPYVRQEDISDPEAIFSNTDYKEKLVEAVRQDFWQKKDIKQFIKSSGFSGRSDLSVYFYVHTLKLLNITGLQTFICTLSWADVEYGAWLQKLILDECGSGTFYDNQHRRSFANAAVNTIISVLRSPGDKTAKQGFDYISFKKTFEESTITENLLSIEKENADCEKDVYRIRKKTKQQLLRAGTRDNKYQGSKWAALHLRAPESFLLLDDKIASKMVSLTNPEVAKIKRGIGSGAVKFFYLDESTINTFGIEAEYLRPILTSSQGLRNITFDTNKYIFYCDKSKGSLLNTGALAYIQWGESEKFHTRTTTKQNHPYWYSANGEEIEVILLRFWDRKFFSPISKVPSLCSDNFFFVRFQQNGTIGQAVLNSTIYFYYVSVFGRVNQGEGVLATYGYEFDFLKIPRLEMIDNGINSAFKHLRNRPVESIFVECGIDPEETEQIIELQEPKPLEDRARLDNFIFDSLGLTAIERKDIYRGVCRLATNRLNKAKSV